MTGIHSRRLRHRIEIQQPIESQDPATGAVTYVWTEYGQRWAEYVPSSVREFIAAASYQSEVKGRFVLREDPDVTPQMRVIYRGQVFAILGILPDPDSGLEYMTLPVTEGVVYDGS